MNTSLLGYKKKFLKAGNGRGLGTYFKDGQFCINEVIDNEKFQVSCYENQFLNLDVMSLYRSQVGSSSEVLNAIKRLLNDKRRTLMIGDFNLCYYENFHNPLIQGFIAIGFQQVVHEPTHVRGRIIDHAYIRDPSRRLKLYVERYSPYYSDHDALCISLTEDKES